MSKLDAGLFKSKLLGLILMGAAVASCSSEGGIPNAVNLPTSNGSATAPESVSAVVGNPSVTILSETEVSAGDTFRALVPTSLEPGEDLLGVRFPSGGLLSPDLLVPETEGFPIVEAIVPMGVCPGFVDIVTTFEAITSDQPITVPVGSLPDPEINAIDPEVFLPGEMVTLTGTFFSIDSVTVPVDGGGRVTPPSLVVTPNQITFTVPVNGVSGGVEVTNSGCDDGMANTASAFYELLGAPDIEAVEFFVRQVGQDLEIFGTNFWSPSFDVDTNTALVNVNVQSISFDRTLGVDPTITFIEGGLGSGSPYEFFLGEANDPAPQGIRIPVVNIPDPTGATGRGRIVLNGVTGSDSTDRRVIVLP